jgi:UDP-N-acetyl-D-glucosamine dehydrogenase
VLGVGVAYKRNIADDRESPSRDVLDRLATRGAVVGVHDPLVPLERLARDGYVVVADLGAGLTTSGGWDLAIVLTDHDDVDYAALAERVPLVFDTRGVYRRLGLRPANVVVL